MPTADRVRDRRPVRRVAADEAAPLGSGEWPASIPAVAQLLQEGLDLPAGVTLLVGENGSGKSTLVEAVAMAFGLAAEGGTRNVQEGTRATESPLHRWIKLERSPGAPRWGFFLRAETLHGYFTRQESFSTDRDPLFHEMSHGESFLAVLRTRFDSPGLYCLDEPEAALSFSAQIALVGTLHELAAAGAQVLCATHSPPAGGPTWSPDPGDRTMGDPRRGLGGTRARHPLAALPRTAHAIPAPRHRDELSQGTPHSPGVRLPTTSVSVAQPANSLSPGWSGVRSIGQGR